MPIDKKFIPVVAIAVAAAGLATVEYIKIRRTERQKRTDIRTETEKEIAAIWRAGAKVQERIKRGEYTNRSMDDIDKDFQFHRIAERFED